MDPTDLRAQAQRWRALAERCDDRGARALKDAAATLEREADALDGDATARFRCDGPEPPR
jgi:hypothetical protein